MKALSQDLRERIMKAYESGKYTRAQVAERFGVSDSLVKKLQGQKKRLGHIRDLFERVGRKQKLAEEQREQMRELIKSNPGVTLEEIRQQLGVECTLPTIHYTLRRMDITFKKRRYEPASKTETTSRKHAVSGKRSK